MKLLREGTQNTSGTAPSARTALGELSPNKRTKSQRAATPEGHLGHGRPELVRNYKTLTAEYKKLSSRYLEACKALQGCRFKLRQRTDAIDQWAKHADLLQEKNQNLRNKLKARCAATDGAADRAEEPGDLTLVEDEALDTVAPTRPSPSPSFDQGLSFSPPLIVDADKNGLFLPPPHPPMEAVLGESGSSATVENRTTADHLDLPPQLEIPAERPLVTVKPELSSDGPVFVSTRPARKRKLGKEEPKDGRLQRIKSEHSSSSGPEIIGESQHFSAAENIDFEEDVHVPTPRKRRFLPHDHRGNLDADSEGTPKPRLADVLRHEALRSHTPDKLGAPSHRAMVPKPSPRVSSALHDDFPHLPRPVQGATTDTTAFAAPCVSHLTLGIMDLAEDGDEGSRGQQRPATTGRLDALLNSPSISALTPLNRATRHDAQGTRAASFNIGLQVPRETTLIESETLRGATVTPTMKLKSAAMLSPQLSVTRDRAPKRPSILRDDLPRGRSATREETPLRERPVERLRPEDFKPNPRYNDGLSYVYDEVVRGKDARAALSGCIDPKCCGKTFRRFAEAERKAAGTSVTTRAEDISLLEKYLGDQAWQLGTMTREEKESTWLQAKTWELANKFGKHRHRYSRMPTPPGFWNVDFPNTQERAEELRQAEEIRRALVQDRYLEAMRCGGSWLFRDEEPR